MSDEQLFFCRVFEKTSYFTYHVYLLRSRRVSWYAVILNGGLWQNCQHLYIHADNVNVAWRAGNDPYSKKRYGNFMDSLYIALYTAPI
jgi:hypothetical protein